jgi:protein gp37
MSSTTTIEWTDVTDNIIVVENGGWWCRKISPGCTNCYAARLNLSPYFGGNKLPYTGDAPKLELRLDLLDGWKRQKKAKKHFVASMTDVFGEWVSAEWQFKMLDAMAAAPLQTFQVLTKRADVMALHVVAWLKARGLAKVPANIWLGFTAENQEWFDKRWAHVQALLPFKSVLFVSAEPLLGPLSIAAARFALDQLICGGESGPGARPMHPDWARPLRNECLSFRIRFFFKQWGEYGPCVNLDAQLALGDGAWKKYMVKLGKKTAGRKLDGEIWSQFPA